MNRIRNNEKTILYLIWGISILVPVLVAVLLNPRFPQLELGFDTSILPKINAFINFTVSVLLVLAYILIRRKQVSLHKSAMLIAFGLSAVFLVLYVLYHISTGHTPYCEAGPVPSGLYYFVLISHIVLSVFIVPLACFSIFRALSERFDKHRKIARISLPLWLYVSVTGVLVYLFISPCYSV